MSSYRASQQAVHAVKAAARSQGLWIGGAAALVAIGTVQSIKTEELKSSHHLPHATIHEGFKSKGVFIWGDNRYNIATLGNGDAEWVKKPKGVTAFDGLALRDLVLHETYAAAVDQHGNVLQWGDGFDGSGDARGQAVITLRGKNIVRLAATKDKIFALSKRGELFVIPSDRRRQQANSEAASSSSSWWPFSTAPGSDFVQLTTASPLRRGEKFIQLSAGIDHLLALTSSGRSFALPLNMRANRNGQLGVRDGIPVSDDFGATQSTASLVPEGFEYGDDETGLTSKAATAPRPFGLTARYEGLTASRSIPEIWLDNPLRGEGKAQRVLGPEEAEIARVAALAEQERIVTPAEKDIRFATVLLEVPALRNLQVTQLVAGARHSLALTNDHRVLAWGANGYGQLGLGPLLNFPVIPTPIEVPLPRTFGKTSRIVCTRIAAGGDTSYYVVNRVDTTTGQRTVDLVASGHGQFGEMGNGSGSPVRVKTVSGLIEFSETTGQTVPIPIYDLSVGKSHAIAVLDNAVEQHDARFGRDVFVWGHNERFQLGTGKRTNLNTPQHLKPLPYASSIVKSGLLRPREDTISSGTTSPMPHSRLQVAPALKVDGLKIEEAVVAGHGTSAVYWRIVD